MNNDKCCTNVRMPRLLCSHDHKNPEAQPHSEAKSKLPPRRVYSQTQGVTDKHSNMATDRKCFKNIF